MFATLRRIRGPRTSAGERDVQASAEQRHPQSAVVTVAEAAGDPTNQLDEPLDRLTGPLFDRPVAKWPKSSARDFRKVRLSIAFSATEQDRRDSSVLIVMPRPARWSWCGEAGRSCWGALEGDEDFLLRGPALVTFAIRGH